MPMVKGFQVALTEDVSMEEFEAIKAAVLMVRGVEDVEPSLTASADWMNRRQIRRELLDRLLKIADEAGR